MTSLGLECFEGHPGFSESRETGVSKLVTRRMIQSSALASSGHDLIETLRAERSAAAGSFQHHEHERRVRVGRSLIIEIALEHFEEARRDRHDPLMTALAVSDKQSSIGPTDVLESQAEDFAAAQPGQEHRIDHRPVPIFPERVDQLDHVVVITDLRADDGQVEPTVRLADRG